MSYSDDLDWLARNVHEWPGGDHQPWCYVSFNGRDFSISKFLAVPGVRTCRIDKADWLARRTELQNKPSWNDAPESAEWLIQHPSGIWVFGYGCVEECISDAVWLSIGPCGKTGEVIGCWRDTLEQRPDMHKTTPEIDTSAERVQKSAESMGKWHERGELPPVGTKCEYRLSTTSPWYPCEIKYVIHDDGVVMMREDGFEQFCSINSKLQPVSFRPIRTERDDAIEAMKDHCPYPGSWETTYRLFAESLYDAGYRAGGSE